MTVLDQPDLDERLTASRRRFDADHLLRPWSLRLFGRCLPDGERLAKLLGDRCQLVGSGQAPDVLLLGWPDCADVRFSRAEWPYAWLIVLLPPGADSTSLVAAYDCGADLVVKGADTRELAARVRSLLRRGRRQP